jgi:hypothetical protein
LPRPFFFFFFNSPFLLFSLYRPQTERNRFGGKIQGHGEVRVKAARLTPFATFLKETNK